MNILDKKLITILVDLFFITMFIIQSLNQKSIMKKLFILLAVGSIAFGTTVTSCKKVRNCVCTYEDGEKESFPVPALKKKDAKTYCETESGGGVSCKLD